MLYHSCTDYFLMWLDPSFLGVLRRCQQCHNYKELKLCESKNYNNAKQNTLRWNGHSHLHQKLHQKLSSMS